ncbi:MAG: class I SAM-dependent methyltransferase [Methylotenera sp.]|nr:class I SAM-dependent methyltransferase [Methylotenera sp.]MDP1960531.1 class I SAM-dependent methyltransferase [Methylotenera sp.]
MKEMQNKSCSYCGAGEIHLYTRLSSAVFKGDYSIEICDSCGVALTNPKPKTNIVHYGEAVRDQNEREVADFKESSRKVVVTALQLYTNKYFTAPLSLLDIGCGFGFLAGEARRLGLHTTGIEPSVSMAEFASKSGAEIFVGSLFDFNSYEKYDILHLESVLEHIEDVTGLLTFLREHSKNDSIIIFGQALYDGLLPKIFRKFWYGWSPAEHFWHFSESAFSRLLLTNGFEILQVERTSLIHSFYFGLKLRSLIFQNSKALVSLVAAVFKLGDHGYFYVSRLK